MKTLLCSLALVLLQNRASASHAAAILWTSMKADFPQGSLNLEFTQAKPGWHLKSLEAKSPTGEVTRLDQTTLETIGTITNHQLYEFGSAEDPGLVLMLDFRAKHGTGDQSVLLWYYWHGKSPGTELYHCDTSGDDPRWVKAKSTGELELNPVPTGDPSTFFTIPARCSHVVLRAEPEKIALEARTEGEALASLTGSSGDRHFTVPAAALKGIRRPDLLSFEALIHRDSPNDVEPRIAPAFALVFNHGTGVTYPASTDKDSSSSESEPLTVLPRCSFQGLFTPDMLERSRTEPLATRDNCLEYYMGPDGREILRGAHNQW
ncbi:hypothetical protein [Luteolibacter sp. LG18]|uniref:hypothetical protein n=1 Tax=Luteolibacter sp. LG18 TaxID=2819286 RepID=UPI002B2F70AE|nr:hypothetical protein llg_03870 [Luteolibacter sp. LG18]